MKHAPLPLLLALAACGPGQDLKLGYAQLSAEQPVEACQIFRNAQKMYPGNRKLYAAAEEACPWAIQQISDEARQDLRSEDLQGAMNAARRAAFLYALHPDTKSLEAEIQAASVQTTQDLIAQEDYRAALAVNQSSLQWKPQSRSLRSEADRIANATLSKSIELGQMGNYSAAEELINAVDATYPNLTARTSQARADLSRTQAVVAMRLAQQKLSEGQVASAFALEHLAATLGGSATPNYDRFLETYGVPVSIDSLQSREGTIQRKLGVRAANQFKGLPVRLVSGPAPYGLLVDTPVEIRCEERVTEDRGEHSFISHYIKEPFPPYTEKLSETEDARTRQSRRLRKLQDVEERRQALAVNRPALKEELQELTARVEELEARIETQQTRKGNLNTSLDALTEKIQGVKTALEADPDNASLRDDLQRLRASARQSRADLADLEERLQESKDRREIKNRQRNEAQQRVRASREELETLTQESATLQERVATASLALARLERELAALPQTQETPVQATAVFPLNTWTLTCSGSTWVEVTGLDRRGGLSGDGLSTRAEFSAETSDQAWYANRRISLPKNPKAYPQSEEELKTAVEVGLLFVAPKAMPLITEKLTARAQQFVSSRREDEHIAGGILMWKMKLTDDSEVLREATRLLYDASANP